ncbi:MAG: hypothetical protein JNL05_00440 [Flavobacteriales bacterium]|nr:hypothetical protein [Flavobacteriales bacterium]
MAGNVRTDEVQLRVVIDGSPARKELAQLSQETYKLRDDLKGMKKGSDEANAALAKIAQNEARMQALRNELGVTGLSLKELRAEAAKLEGQLRTMVPGTQEWAEVNAQLQQVKNRLNEVGSAAGRHAAAWESVREQYKLTDMTMEQLQAEHRRLMAMVNTTKPNTKEWHEYRRALDAVDARQRQLATGGNTFGNWMRRLKDELKGVAGLALGLFVGNAVFNGIGQWVSGLGKTSDKLADMGKALDLDADKVRELDAELAQLNTRTSRNDLRDIAIGLGQSGIEASKESVAAIDRIQVALGDAFGPGMAREIATTMTVVRNNLTDLRTSNYGEDVGRIANAFNVLEASGLATGPVLADIVNRTAGVAREYDVASASILGTAASFQELGINQERGSTAWTRLMQKMASEPEKFRKVVKGAGMDVSEFNRLLNEDMAEAVLMVAKATTIAGDSNTAYGAILKELDTDGAGVSEMLSKLGANQDLVREKTRLAAEALKGQDSVLEEYNKKNNTLQANLERIGKWFNGLFNNPTITNGLNRLVKGFADLVSPKVSEGLERERIQLLALQSQILDTNTSTETRVKLIKELQAKYPQLLKDLNAEKVSNQELTTAIGKLNQQLVSRIILQQQQEQVDSQAENIANRAINAAEQEAGLRDLMVKLMDERNIKLKEGLTLQEQAERVLRKLQRAENDPNAKGFTPYFMRDSQSLRRALDSYLYAQKQLNDANRIGADLEAHRAKLLDILGIKMEEVSQAGAEVATETTVQGETPEERAARLAKEQADREAAAQKYKAATDAMKQFREQLRELQAGMLRDALSSDEQEIAEVDAKYAKLRAEILKNEAHTAEDLKLLDEVYAQERANAVEAGGQKRIDAARAVADELRRVEQEAQDQLYLDGLSAEDREVAQLLSEFDQKAAAFKAGSEEMARLTELYEKKLAGIRSKYRKAELDADQLARIEKLRNMQETAQGVASAVAGVQSILAASAAAQGKNSAEQTEFQRMLALTQIGISSAVGVAQAIEKGIASGPFPGNLAAIATGVGAVLSGIGQAMAILNTTPPTPTPPGMGGQPNLQNVPIGEAGMVIDGPRHSEGGLQVWDPVRQRLVAEIEGGETVLSRKWTRANADLLPALLQASREGRRMNWLNTAPAPINVGAVRSAMQVVHLAAGGRVPHVRGTALVNAAGPAGGPGGTPDWALAMLAKLDRVALAAERFPKRLQAEVVNSPKKDRTDAEYARIKGRNSFRRAS